MKYLLGMIALVGLLSLTTKELFLQTGNASYYGPSLHGHRTASGQVYYKDSMVCAHKTLKFGTMLRVTNLNNDSVVIVKVIDRMGRTPHIVDLSSGAAKKLGFFGKGIAKVKVEEIDPTTLQPIDSLSAAK